MKKYILFMLLVVSLVSEGKADELYRVATERVNVREKPTANSKAMGYVPQGTNILVIDRSNSLWYKVRVREVEGYINSNYLQIVETEVVNNTSQKDKVNKIALGILGGLILIGLIAAVNIKTKKPTQFIPLSDKHQVQSPLSTSTTVIFEQKSVTAAIILAFLFGPFGMFYSTVKGAVIMLLLPIISFIGFWLTASNLNDSITAMYFIGTLLFYIVFYWFICIMWSALAASQKNKIVVNNISHPQELRP